MGKISQVAVVILKNRQTNPPEAKHCGDNRSDIPLLFLETPERKQGLHSGKLWCSHHYASTQRSARGSLGIVGFRRGLLGELGDSWALPGVIGPETGMESVMIYVNLQQKNICAIYLHA